MRERKRPLPIGAVRVRTRRRDSDGAPFRIRVVKVRMDGPVGRRWIRYARWWWERNVGPIPEGMHVVHRDGDTMNDDPANYELVSRSEKAATLRARMTPEQERRRVEAVAEHNRLRSRVKRAAGWLASQWYPVDHAARVIYNRPRRVRAAVYEAMGVPTRAVLAANGDGADAAALGWPGLSYAEATILAVLAAGPDGPPLPTSRIWSGVNALRAERGDEPLLRTTMPQYMSRLRRAGLIRRRGGGRRESVYRITPAALEARGPWTPAVPVRGADLASEAYLAYKRVDDEVGVRQRRVDTAEAFTRLTRAIAGVPL